MSPDLVQEDGAAVRHFELAAFLRIGAGERPFFVAEELRFQQRLRQRRARYRDEGFRRAVARVMDGARDHLFAGAAFSLDQHRAAQARHLGGQVQDLPHARILADHVVRGVLARQLLAQDRVFPLQVLHLDDAVHQQRDLFRIARLDDVLLRAFLHSGDGGIHGGIGGDDDDGCLRVQPPDLHHGLDAVHAAGHFQVDEIDGVVTRPRFLQRRVAGCGGVHHVAVFPQPGGQRLTHHLFVIHHQNLPVGFHGSSPCPCQRSEGRVRFAPRRPRKMRRA